jgi:urease subunit alpha
MMVNGGLIAYSLIRDPNASIPTPDPVCYRSIFVARGTSTLSTSLIFTSLRNRLAKKLALLKKLFPVKSCRKTGKKYMVHISLTPKIQIDPDIYTVMVNDKFASTELAENLSLSSLYDLFR